MVRVGAGASRVEIGNGRVAHAKREGGGDVLPKENCVPDVVKYTCKVYVLIYRTCTGARY